MECKASAEVRIICAKSGETASYLDYRGDVPFLFPFEKGIGGHVEMGSLRVLGMSRYGAATLSDVLEPTLTIACERCLRRGVYSVQRLYGRRGDARLPDILNLFSADCSMRLANKFTDTCKAKFDWQGGAPRLRDYR
jgi:hypothetical protein